MHGNSFVKEQFTVLLVGNDRQTDRQTDKQIYLFDQIERNTMILYIIENVH